MITIWNLQRPAGFNATLDSVFVVPETGMYTFYFSGSAWAETGGMPISVSVVVDNGPVAGEATIFAPLTYHVALTSGAPVSLQLESGSHVAQLVLGTNTNIDENDFFTLYLTSLAV